MSRESYMIVASPEIRRDAIKPAYLCGSQEIEFYRVQALVW